MKIIDKMSRSLGLSDEQDEEKKSDMTTQDELQNQQPETNDAPIQPPPVNPTGHNVVDFNSAIAARDNLMNNTTNNIKPLTKSKITTVKPKTFDDDAKVIADCLRDDVPVIVNFEDTPPDHARRILDFASGITYAIGGLVQQVSEYVFICTPKTVSVVVNKEEHRHEKDISWLTGKF